MKGISKREAYKDALTNAAEMIRGHVENGGIDETNIGEYSLDEYKDACFRVFLKLEALAKKEKNNIFKILYP